MWSSARPTISFNMPKNSTFTRTIVIVTDGPGALWFHADGLAMSFGHRGVGDWGLAGPARGRGSGRCETDPIFQQPLLEVLSCCADKLTSGETIVRAHFLENERRDCQGGSGGGRIEFHFGQDQAL